MATASNFGYTDSLIEILVQKHKTKKLIKNATAVLLAKEKKKKIEMPFSQKFINKVFRKYDFQSVFTNNNKIKNLLGNTKGKDNPEDCSGIFKISCQNC